MNAKRTISANTMIEGLESRRMMSTTASTIDTSVATAPRTPANVISLPMIFSNMLRSWSSTSEQITLNLK